MGGECAMNDTEGLHPASGSLPEGGPGRRARARLRLPGTGRTIRVRSFALGLSLAAHAAFFGILLVSRLPTAPPAPPPLINVDFVEIPGARGGGGTPSQLSAAKMATPAQASKSPATPNVAPRQQALPQAVSPSAPAISASATGASATGASAPPPSAAAEGRGQGGGSGGGSGGGHGTGSGTSVGGGSGQGGVAVDRMPTPLRQVKPRYPMAARRMGQSGQVLLRLFVDQEGSVREVTVVRAEPSGVFEDAAMEAVRKWRFAPAVAHGAPVGVWMTLPVRFALDDH